MIIIPPLLKGFLAASEEAPNKSHKKKAPKGKQRKNLTKVEYIFVKSSKRTTKYHDYFNPSPEVEIRLIGMEKKVNKRNSECVMTRISFDLGVFLDVGDQDQETTGRHRRYGYKVHQVFRLIAIRN